MKKIVKRSTKPLDGLKILFADDETSIRELDAAWNCRGWDTR